MAIFLPLPSVRVCVHPLGAAARRRPSGDGATVGGGDLPYAGSSGLSRCDAPLLSLCLGRRSEPSGET